MHPKLKEIKAEIDSLHAEIAKLPPGGFQHRVYVEHLQTLWNRYSTISASIPPTQPPQPPSIAVPIKCGMRGITNLFTGGKPEKWDWSNLNEKQASALMRVQSDIQATFFTIVENHILKLIVLSGGLKKSLTSLGFESLVNLPEFVRKEQGPALFKAFTEKLLK